MIKGYITKKTSRRQTAGGWLANGETVGCLSLFHIFLFRFENYKHHFAVIAVMQDIVYPIGFTFHRHCVTFPDNSIVNYGVLKARKIFIRRINPDPLAWDFREPTVVAIVFYRPKRK